MMLSLPTYNCYKDSGVDWLGEIPAHWGITRMANFGSFTKGKGISKNDISEQGLPALLYGDIYTKYNIKTDHLITSVPKYIVSNSVPIYFDDILFTGSGETLEDIGKCIVYKGNSVGYAGGDVIIFRQNKCNSLYLSYLFNSSFFNEQKAKLAKGEIIVHIYSSKLKTIKFCLPPLEEQEKIVKFLDRKCEEVEKSIELKQRLITLLEEQKSIVINQAITKGLNPNAPMKDSGIDWLGDIPAHWEVTKIKYCYQVFLGKMLQPNQKSPKDVKKPYLRSANLSLENVSLDDVKEMWFSPNEISKNQLKKGDVLVNEGGDVGKSSFWNYDMEMYIQNSVQRLRSLNDYQYSKFLFYWLNLLKKCGHIDSLCNSSTIAHYTYEKVKETLLINPPIEEQQKIAEYLEQKTAEIEELKEKTLQQIEKLKEFKQILIAEAVTGKIKV